MTYHIKKLDFQIVIRKQNNNGVVISFGNSKKIYRFGLVKKGYLYLLSGDKWNLLDIDQIIVFKRRYKDPVDKGTSVLICAMFKIGDRRLKLNGGESALIESLIYDMLAGDSIDWIPSSKNYRLNDKTFNFDDGYFKFPNDSLGYHEILKESFWRTS